MRPTAQAHLGYASRVNKGAYYTPRDAVEVARDLLSPHLKKNTVILDNACGYGSFLDGWGDRHVVGCDIDETAVRVARKHHPHAALFRRNALSEVGREKFNIPDKARLAMVGNPPYNDKTSLIRHRIKQSSCRVDRDLKHRDLGISFLLGYDKLRADVICVLHPLSYLIKKANFRSARGFTGNYKLVDGRLISSADFPEASKSTHFPILIALYVRDNKGMTYEDIENFEFKVRDGGALCLRRHDFIGKYIEKYPNKNRPVCDDSLFFWTLRDINALKRNGTFMRRHSDNTIVIDKSKLDYYAYVDVFKRNLHRIPYYFGNCDVIIRPDLYKRYRDYFIADAIKHHPHLAKHFPGAEKPPDDKRKIDEYFSLLMPQHAPRQPVARHQ